MILSRGRCNEEHFCEIILNLDDWFRIEMSFKDISIFSSCGYFIQQSGTVAILAEDIMGKISVKLFRIWASG